MGKLSNNVALVTGSSRGIGAAAARELAREGAKVAIHGRDTEALAAVRAEIEAAGGQAMQATADVTSFVEIEALREQVEGRFGPIDILVTSAGGSFSKPGPLETLDQDAWHATIDGNLTATFLTIKSILPGMKRRNSGSIITISSSAGRVPQPQVPVAYSAAKAGIQMLTQVVAAQAGPSGVRVNCIAPDTILTERNQQRIPEGQKQAMAENRALKRLGTPEDVAQAVVYLASDEAAWITGVIFDVAGGAIMV